MQVSPKNPAKGFIPSPGEIELIPPRRARGPVDSHAYGGYTVSPYYDSMISKVITYGRTRKIALDRMYRALSEYLIRGIDTNVDFLKAVLLDPAFRQGKPRPHTLRSF